MRMGGLIWLGLVCGAAGVWAQGPGGAAEPGRAAGRPAITGIAFVRMDAADVAASDRFYRMLGLPVEKGDGPVRRYDVNAAQWLETVPLPEPAPASRQALVGFTTADAAGLERYLGAHGVQPATPLRDGMFTVIDPEGNRIAFVQAGSHAAAVSREGGAARTGVATTHRILHAGFTVRDQAAENRFYRELLGFRPYWHGGMEPGRDQWISQQVPDGTDWLEYMIEAHPAADPAARRRQLGVDDHVSLGVQTMPAAEKALAENGCAATPYAAECTAAKLGRDGKVQMNLYDPDGTRIEFMEFKPTGETCCSAYTANHPDALDKE